MTKIYKDTNGNTYTEDQTIQPSTRYEVTTNDYNTTNTPTITDTLTTTTPTQETPYTTLETKKFQPEQQYYTFTDTEIKNMSGCIRNHIIQHKTYPISVNMKTITGETYRVPYEWCRAIYYARNYYYISSEEARDTLTDEQQDYSSTLEVHQYENINSEIIENKTDPRRSRYWASWYYQQIQDEKQYIYDTFYKTNNPAKQIEHEAVSSSDHQNRNNCVPDALTNATTRLWDYIPEDTLWEDIQGGSTEGMKLTDAVEGIQKYGYKAFFVDATWENIKKYNTIDSVILLSVYSSELDYADYVEDMTHCICVPFFLEDAYIENVVDNIVYIEDSNLPQWWPNSEYGDRKQDLYQRWPKIQSCINICKVAGLDGYYDYKEASGVKTRQMLVLEIDPVSGYIIDANKRVCESDTEFHPTTLRYEFSTTEIQQAVSSLFQQKIEYPELDIYTLYENIETLTGETYEVNGKWLRLLYWMYTQKYVNAIDTSTEEKVVIDDNCDALWLNAHYYDPHVVEDYCYYSFSPSLYAKTSDTLVLCLLEALARLGLFHTFDMITGDSFEDILNNLSDENASFYGVKNTGASSLLTEEEFYDLLDISETLFLLIPVEYSEDIVNYMQQLAGVSSNLEKDKFGYIVLLGVDDTSFSYYQPFGIGVSSTMETSTTPAIIHTSLDKKFLYLMYKAGVERAENQGITTTDIYTVQVETARMRTTITDWVFPTVITLNTAQTYECSLFKTTNEPLSGATLHIYLDGVQLDDVVTDTTGKASINITVTTYGKHTLRAVFDETSTLRGSTSEQTFNNLSETSITIEGYQKDFIYTIPQTITGYLYDETSTPLSGQTLSISVNNQEVDTVTTSDTGMYTYTLSPDNEGEYAFMVQYDGSDKYQSSSNTVTRTAYNNSPSFNDWVEASSIALGESFTYSATVENALQEALTGKTIRVYVNDTLNTTLTTSSTGGLEFTYTPVNAGEYNIKFEFEEDEVYQGVSDTKTFSITSDTTLTMTGIISPCIYTESQPLTGVLTNSIGTPVVGATIHILLDETEIGTTITGDDGTYTYNTTAGSTGNHTFQAIYEATTYLTSSSISNTLKAYNNTTHIGYWSNSQLKIGEETTIGMTLYNDIGPYFGVARGRVHDVPFKVYINDEYYSTGTSQSMGQCEISYTPKASGTYTFKFVFEGDNIYQSCNASKSFTVNPTYTASFEEDEDEWLIVAKDGVTDVTLDSKGLHSGLQNFIYWKKAPIETINEDVNWTIHATVNITATSGHQIGIGFYSGGDVTSDSSYKVQWTFQRNKDGVVILRGATTETLARYPFELGKDANITIQKIGTQIGLYLEDNYIGSVSPLKNTSTNYFFFRNWSTTGDIILKKLTWEENP